MIADIQKSIYERVKEMEDELQECVQTGGQIENRTSERIIEACGRLFYEKGYINTSYDDICREANINRGLIHYYFKNKSNITTQLEKKIGERRYQLLEADTENLENEVVNLYWSYARLKEIYTDYPVLCYYLESYLDINMFQNSEVFEIQKINSQRNLQKVTLEKSKENCCYLRGAERFLVYAYAKGFLQSDVDTICDVYLTMKLKLYGYKEEEIQKYFSQVKELYRKKSTVMGSDMFPMLQEESHGMELVTENIQKERQRFLQEYEKNAKKDRKRKRKKKEIFDFAKHIFWEEGYDALTFKRISEELGISQGSIAYHFKKKHRISYLVYEEINCQIWEAIDQIAPDESQEVKLLMQEMINGMIYQGEAGQRYMDLFYKQSEDPGHYQMKLMEMEDEVAYLLKKGLDSEENLRLYVAMHHGIGQEIIFQNYIGNYVCDIGDSIAREMDFLCELLHVIGAKEDKVSMKKAKKYLEQWNFSLEKDFQLHYEQKKK